MTGGEKRLFKVVGTVLLLLILGWLIDLKLGFAHAPFVHEIITVDAQSDDQQKNVQDNTGDVGQNEGKIVTQDEPNSTQDPNSPALKKDIPVATPAQAQPTTTSSPEIYYPPEVTEVAGAQDVKTNPQSEVGGIEEANQLFKGEDIGKQPEPIEKKQVNWMIILAIGAGAIICAVLGYLVLRRHKSDADPERKE